MTPSDDVLFVTQAGSRRLWELRRPERANALGPTMAGALNKALAELQQDFRDGTARREAEPPCRLLIIRATCKPSSQGPIWIAGGDLTELAAVSGPADVVNYAASLSLLGEGLAALPVPVVMTIDGAAIGGGAEFALFADLRIASREASLDFKQVAAGLATGYGSCHRLIELIGKAHAQSILLQAKKLSADECLQLGLFHELAADKSSLEKCLDEVAARLEGFGYEALRAQKKMLNQSPALHPGARPGGGELAIFAETWGNPVHKAFLDRFAKRKRP